MTQEEKEKLIKEINSRLEEFKDELTKDYICEDGGIQYAVLKTFEQTRDKCLDSLSSLI